MPDWLQRLLGIVGGTLTLPLLGLLAVAVKLESPGPAIYRARRVGQEGRTFTCFKLRTMSGDHPDRSSLTRSGDPRVTHLGRILRRARLDELPQLWNVARGEMRFVGPRPEAPEFVDLTDPLHREVFAARPGITGLTQLLYADEASRLDGPEPEETYRNELLPAKVRLDALYLRHRSTSLDLWILAQTPRAVLGRPVRLPQMLSADLPVASGADVPAARGDVPATPSGDPSLHA